MAAVYPIGIGAHTGGEQAGDNCGFCAISTAERARVAGAG